MSKHPGYLHPDTIKHYAAMQPRTDADMDVVSMATELQETHESNVHRFAERMQEELNANKHKGNFADWHPSVCDAAKELEHHVTKLILAMSIGKRDAVDEYTADCANICMKINEEFGNGTEL